MHIEYAVRVATASVAADTCRPVACRMQRVINVGWDPYLKNQNRIGRYRGGVPPNLGRILRSPRAGASPVPRD